MTDGEGYEVDPPAQTVTFTILDTAPTMNETITQTGGDTLIADGEQSLAKLLGVNASSLTANSFVFC